LGVGFCATAWIAASWIHQRVAFRFELRDAIRYGLLVNVLATPLVLATAVPGIPFLVTLLGWVVLGVGSGFAFQAVNLFVMSRAAKGAEAQATSSVQLANTIGAAVGTSGLGLLLNVGRDAGLSLAGALFVVLAACWLGIALAAVVAWGLPQIRDRQGGTASA
jgi:hypothetical protein